MRMMVVMPALAETDEGDPPVIPRIIASLEAARAPHVTAGIDQPGAMVPHHDTQADSPEHQAKTSHAEQRDSQDKRRKPVIVVQPKIKTMLRQVRGILRH